VSVARVLPSQSRPHTEKRPVPSPVRTGRFLFSVTAQAFLSVVLDFLVTLDWAGWLDDGY